MLQDVCCVYAQGGKPCITPIESVLPYYVLFYSLAVSPAGDMTKIFFIAVLSLFSMCSHAEKLLQCDYGPVTKFIGDGDWAVFSCRDNKTVVLYTQQENPAAEFYFMFYIKNGHYELYGEGNGDKKKTAKVHDILSAYSDTQISALILQTRNIAGNSK